MPTGRYEIPDASSPRFPRTRQIRSGCSIRNAFSPFLLSRKPGGRSTTGIIRNIEISATDSFISFFSYLSTSMQVNAPLAAANLLLKFMTKSRFQDGNLPRNSSLKSWNELSLRAKRTARCPASFKLLPRHGRKRIITGECWPDRWPDRRPAC